MSMPGQALWCDGCQVAYDVPNLELGRCYKCARCREAIVSPEGATVTTWLYTASRSPNAAPTVDDARTTWSDTTQDAKDSPPLRSFDRYEISDELGRGGMGVVYRAWDPTTQQEVALKVLLGGRWADRTAIERFLREARAAAKLEHPGLVRVLDSGEWQGQPFYAMELIDGPSLKDVLDDIGRPPLEETLRIGAAIARALDHAHARGVTHRDVKPENVLLKVTGEPVLTDFGLVLEAQDARLTHTGQVMGTPAYLAPELARGEKHPDWPRVDIYALGTLLYELATGRPAYDGDSGMQVLMDVLDAPPDSPRSVADDIPRDLEVLIQRAMARFPSARFARASVLANELDRIAAGRPIESPPLSLRYRSRIWFQRHGRTVSIATATVALVAAILAIGVGARERMIRTERDQAWESARTRWFELFPELDRLEQAGDRAAADAAFRTFVHSDQWRGAPALSDAWRVRARHLQDRGDPDAALDALARGWAVAPTDVASHQALDGLLEALAARWWYDRIETLAGDHPSAPAEHRRAVAAVARRDLPAAGRAWVAFADGQPATAPLVEVLLRGTPTPWQAGQARVLDDGTVLLIGQTGPHLAEPQPTLPSRGELDAGRTIRTAFPAGPDRLVTWGEDRAELLEWDGHTWSPALAWEEAPILGAARLGPDEAPTVLVGVGPYARHLLRLDRQDDGTWTRQSAHDGTNQSASDVVALTRAELDGDGTPDVLVAMGPWNAFDVRWLSPDSAGQLQLRARRKLGYASALQPLRVGGQTLVAVAKSDQYPSRRTFPADQPYGEPAGLYLLDPEQALATVDTRRLPTPVGQPPPATGVLVTGDLDGDGLEDVAMGVTTEDDEPWLFLYRQDADGRLQHARLQGIELLAGAQLDDDPATELVVGMGSLVPGSHDRPIWVLGTGDQSVPVIERVMRPHEPVPRELPPAASRAWSRAERLASAGLFAPAAGLFTDLAADAEDPEHSDAAWLRAATLWLAADRPDRAADQIRNVRLPDNRAVALDLRSQALIRAYRFDEAAANDAVLERIEPLPDAIAVHLEGRKPLHALHADSPEVAIAFDTPLGAEWTIHSPLGVRRDPRQATLNIDTVVGDGVVAEIALRRTDPVVALDLEGTADRVEWASGLAVTLSPVDGSPELGFRVAGWGGGSLLQRQAGCVLPTLDIVGPRVRAEPSQPLDFRMRIQVAPQLREVQCWLEDGAGARIVETRAPLMSELPEGDWVLRVRAGGAEVATPMLARVRLKQLTLHGMEVDARPTAATAGRLQAEGHLTEALERLGPEPSLLKAALLGELGRMEDALRAVPPDPDPTELGLLLRSRPQLALALRPAWADDWFALWHDTWNVAIVSHPDDPALQERLRTDLDGLASWRPTTREGRAIRTQLLALRGRAWWLGGRSEAARIDLVAAISDVSRVLEDARQAKDGNQLQAGKQVWMDAHALLAAIVLAGGDEVAALEYARGALVHAPFRELAIDRLLLVPAIANKKGDPKWAALLDR